MSLFVAIVPDEACVEDLQQRVHGLSGARLPRDLRWQAPARWHVTLAFLGEQDDDADEAVAARLDALARHTTGPDLHISGAGCFGRQVLWMDVVGDTAEDAEAFAALASTLQSGLRADGFPLERRPWRPHLTIGRTRGGDARTALPYLSTYVGPTWRVRELLAVRSEGGPSPRHLVIHRAELDGAGVNRPAPAPDA